jgi:tetratricopeptide (TPR) repeat protein
MSTKSHLSLFVKASNIKVWTGERSWLICVSAVFCVFAFSIAAPLPAWANKDHPSWAELNDSVKRAPNDFQQWIKKGDAESNALDDDAALKDFTEAIRLAPASPEGYIHRADLYGHLGKFDLAEQDGKKALDKALAMPKPENFFQARNAAARLAHLYELRGDFNSCLLVYEKLHRIYQDPRDAIDIGIYNFKLKHYGVAQKYLESGLQSRPREFESLGVLAECYEREHKYTDALKYYTKAIDIIREEHRNFLTHHRYDLLQKRGELERVMGDEKAAAKDLADAREVRDGIFDIVPFRSSP